MKKNLLLIFIFTFSFSAFAIEIHKVKIATIIPWIQSSSEGCIGGYVCDFFKELNKNLETKVTFQSSSLSRANQAFFKGTQPLGVFMSSPEIDKHYVTLGTLLDMKVGILAAKGAPPLNKKDDLVCTRINNPYLMDGFKYKELSKIKDCFRLMKLGRIKYLQVDSLYYGYLKSHDSDLSKREFGHFNPYLSIPIKFFVNKKIKASPERFKSYEDAFKKIDLKNLAKKYSFSE